MGLLGDRININAIKVLKLTRSNQYYDIIVMSQVKSQYDWLVSDLSSVDRSVTPWVVLYGHRPMYCTNDDRDDCTKFETRTRTGLPLLYIWGLEVQFLQNRLHYFLQTKVVSFYLQTWLLCHQYRV